MICGHGISGRTRSFGLILCCGLFLAGVLATVSAVAQEPVAGPAVTVEMTFGTGIDAETRAVVGRATAFDPQIEKIYCFTRVKGMVPPGSVTHAWYLDGKTMARVELNVGSGNWRTWSNKRIRPDWTGNWEVKVLAANGQVLASGEFVVQ